MESISSQETKMTPRSSIQDAAIPWVMSFIFILSCFNVTHLVLGHRVIYVEGNLSHREIVVRWRWQLIVVFSYKETDITNWRCIDRHFVFGSVGRNVLDGLLIYRHHFVI